VSPTPHPVAAEQEWAARTLRQLQLPHTVRSEDDLLAFVSRYIGRTLVVVPTDGPIINGALDDWTGGSLAVCVPPTTSVADRRRLVCRGAARALYRHYGARNGQPDYSQPIEREIEYMAMALTEHLGHTSRATGRWRRRR
jgi:hypothetical protein